MSKKEVLITGAGGEMGHGLIEKLASEGTYSIVAVDLAPLAPSLASKVSRFYQGDVCDARLMEDLTTNHSFEKIFHLASILSTGGEKNPARAHHVNVGGGFNILNLAKRQSEERGTPVTFMFPSTIAVYGISSLAEKNSAGLVDETQYLNPITMYGINKLYVENMGRYFGEHYKLLESDPKNIKIDFRAIRFPGIVSTDTVPTGGTSDYFPEMLHAAAQGLAYKCFVRGDARLPFMAMPDAVEAILKLSQVDAKSLTSRVFNISAFSLSAEEIRTAIRSSFPQAIISFDPEGSEINKKRQRIVDSWPGDVNDSLARTSWGYQPRFTKENVFETYLIPGIISRYSDVKKKCANH